jgi:hypothetical protein
MSFNDQADKLSYAIGFLLWIGFSIGAFKRLNSAYFHVRRSSPVRRARLTAQLWACLAASFLPTVTSMCLIQLQFPRPHEVRWFEWWLVAFAFSLQPFSLCILLRRAHLLPSLPQ